MSKFIFKRVRRQTAKEFTTLAFGALRRSAQNKWLFIIDSQHPARALLRDRPLAALGEFAKRSVDKKILFGSKTLFGAAKAVGYRPLGVDLDASDSHEKIVSELRRLRHPSLLQ